MGIFLWILSLIIGIVLIPIGLLYSLFSAIWKNKFFAEGLPNINKKCLILATALDIFGNVVCSELFNSILISKTSEHKFGKYGETISEVIGYNLINNTLSNAGKILNNILNFFEKNHTLKVINKV